MSTFAGFFIVILILLIMIAFTAGPSKISNLIGMNEKVKRTIIIFEIIPYILVFLWLTISLIVKLIFDNLISEVKNTLDIAQYYNLQNQQSSVNNIINIIFMIFIIISFIMLIISYIFIMIRMISMSKLGYLKIKYKTPTHYYNCIFYIIDILIIAFPMIPSSITIPTIIPGEVINLNPFNTALYSETIWGKQGSVLAIIAIIAAIICIALNLIFRDIRKTLIFDIVAQLICFTSSLLFISNIASLEMTYQNAIKEMAEAGESVIVNSVSIGCNIFVLFMLVQLVCSILMVTAYGWSAFEKENISEAVD